MQPRKVAFFALTFAMPALVLAAGCSGWDPNRPFERDSPEVKKATAAYDAGDARASATTLEEYLGTGPCREGAIGTPEALAEKREGTFDLGLALFAIADSFGARFQSDGKGTPPPNADPKARGESVTCALRIVQAVNEAPQSGFLLRAKASYLEGNLHFVSGDYAKAIAAYERALVLVPGEPASANANANETRARAKLDTSESVGRDAAWNRAISMRRLENAKDAGPDASSDAGDGGKDGGDGGQDGGGDKDAGNDGGNDGKDAGEDSGSQNGKGPDGGQDAAPEPDEQDGGSGGAKDDASAAPPPPESTGNATPDERILNDLERAPMLQHELSRRAAATRKVRGMADK